MLYNPNSELTPSSGCEKSATTAARKTAQVAERQLVAKGGVPWINCPKQDRQVMDRSGLTKAGRTLDKHGGRPGSVFPKATGNSSSKNMQGQFHLDDVLTHPDSTSYHNRFGGRDVFSPDGRGVRFDAENNLTGFLQPRRIEK